MIFTGRKILKELRELRIEHSNLIHLIKALAKEAGYIVEIHRPEKGSAMIALVKQGDNHVQLHPVEK